MNLKGRNFLKLLDFTPEEIMYLVDLAQDLKEKRKKGIRGNSLKDKNIALIFEKPSTRTRCSFTIGAQEEGALATYLAGSELQLGEKESIEDTARVLGRMFDGIEYRGYGQEIVETLAEYAGVPVWNGLTTEAHPTQFIADALTIRENFGDVRGLTVVFMGDAKNNVANSLMVGCAKLGMNYVACCPEADAPDSELVEKCRAIAAENDCTVTVTSDVDEGTKGAHVIYTDIWVSMGEPASLWEQRIKELSPYQVNTKVMANAADNAIFMHSTTPKPR